MAVAGIVSAAVVAVVVVFVVVLVFLREGQGVFVCVHVCICCETYSGCAFYPLSCVAVYCIRFLCVFFIYFFIVF